ncbi:hypothetical protein L9F63_021032, partial [Diploptera punctata]
GVKDFLQMGRLNTHFFNITNNIISSEKFVQFMTADTSGTNLKMLTFQTVTSTVFYH